MVVVVVVKHERHKGLHCQHLWEVLKLPVTIKLCQVTRHHTTLHPLFSDQHAHTVIVQDWSAVGGAFTAKLTAVCLPGSTIEQICPAVQALGLVWQR